MSAIVDSLAALIAHLKADADIAALCGTRVFGEFLPREEAAFMPRKCIVLRPSGGIEPSYAQGTVPLEARRIDALCYAENVYEADRIRRTLRGFFRDFSRVEQGDTLIHWLRPAGGIIAFVDPDAEWPGVFESYQMLADERALS